MGITRSYNASTRHGEIHLYDTIGKSLFVDGITAQDVSAALDQLRGASELHIYLSSPGGSVFEGVAIYNALRRFPARTTVFVEGVAASIASLIALAGERRVTAANGMWMVHNPSSVCTGGAEAMRKTAEQIESVRAVMVSTYAERTG